MKEGDSFTDIKNGDVSILPEELIAKRKNGDNISADIENYAHKLKRQEYGKKLNYQIENLLFLTGAGSSYLFGEHDKKGKLMCNLWDDAVVLLGGKQNMDIFCKKVRYSDKDEKNEYRKNLEKVLSLAEKAKDYITETIFTTNKSTLAYLPVLGAGEVILMGVDFPMPVMLKVDLPQVEPNSNTPPFKRI